MQRNLAAPLFKLFCRICRDSLVSKTRYRLFNESLTRAGAIFRDATKEDVTFEAQRDLLTICKACYRRLEYIEKTTSQLVAAKEDVIGKFTRNRSFFSDNKRSRIPLSPRMKGVSPTQSPASKKPKDAEKLLKTVTRPSTCVRSLTALFGHDAGGDEVATNLSTLNMIPNLPTSRQIVKKGTEDIAVQCTLLHENRIPQIPKEKVRLILSLGHNMYSYIHQSHTVTMG